MRTHVGFTAIICSPCNPNSVHPHARGVYGCQPLMLFIGLGPSPRTWGLLSSIRLNHSRIRSIPTHVGFTTSGDYPEKQGTVHPHARGVYCMMRVSEAGFHGPSPRTWGLRPATPDPAPAWPVHPHARGVYGGEDHPGRRQGGPSPRTWGLPP